MPVTPVVVSLAFCLGLLATTPACSLFRSEKPSAPQRGAVRIVAPGKVAEPYFGTAPGGRFAVFSDAIVDLPNGRVAWRSSEPVYLAFASRPHTLLRAQGEGVELWNALTGRVESSFAGTPLAHSELKGLMPLQDQQSLVIVDAAEAREVFHAPMAEEALSAVLHGEQLLVLSRKRAPATAALSQEQLTLHSFQWPLGTAGAKHALKIDWRGHQPKPATEDRSPPFLHLDAQGALGVARLFHTSGEGSDKTELYRVAISAAGRVQGANWSNAPFVWPEGGAVTSLVNGGARPIPHYEPPAEVRDALGRLPAIAMGSLAAVEGARVLTHGEGYLCVWSLRAAQREACLRVKHASAGLRSDGRVWLKQENDRAGTWSLTQGLQWEGTGSASEESEGESLDCQLSAQSDPGTARIIVSDAEGPRFFLYDLGPDAWLIALPDGHYVGSADAEKKLAFYDERGALLANEAVSEARDPQRVGQALSSAIDCQH